MPLVYAFIGALLAAFFAHHLWKRHWRAEMQYAVLKDVIAYTATQALNTASSTIALPPAAVSQWLEVTSRVKLLFSPATFAVFSELDKLLTPSSVTTSVQVQQVMAARERALQAMMEEIGIGPAQRYWFDQFL